MVNEGKARLFKNSQGRYLIYLPVDLAEDSMFPLKVNSSMYVRVGFKMGEKTLIVSKWEKDDDEENQTT